MNRYNMSGFYLNVKSHLWSIFTPTTFPFAPLLIIHRRASNYTNVTMRTSSDQQLCHWLDRWFCVQ